MQPSRETVVWWRSQQKDPNVIELKRCLIESCPQLKGKTIESVALEAKNADGFRDAVRVLFNDFLEIKEDVEEKDGFINPSDH